MSSENSTPNRPSGFSLKIKLLILLFWIPIPILFALFVSSFPDTTNESVIITGIPFLALSGIVVWFVIKGSLSERVLKIATGLAALAGLFFASYLTFKWSQGVLPQCASGGCAIAQYSRYADMFFGIRTSTVGVIGYIAVLLSLFIPGKLGRAVTLALATFGFFVSVYLTTSSIFDLETTCQWCLGSASAMTTIFALSSIRVIREYIRD